MAVLAGAAELDDGRVVVEILDQRAGTAWVAQACKDRNVKNPGWAGIVMDSYSGAAAVAPHIIAAGVPVSMATTRDLTTGTADFYDGLTRKDPDTGFPDLRILHPLGGSGFWMMRRLRLVVVWWGLRRLRGRGRRVLWRCLWPRYAR